MNNGLSFVNFPGVRLPATDFKAVANQLQTELFAYELDLSVARTFGSLANPPAIFAFAGNSFYVDQASDVGNASVLFNERVQNANPLGVFVQPGFIARVPFNQLMIANTAQAGKKLRFFFGVDVDFVPSINGTLSISGNINALPALDTQGATLDRGFIYGAAFVSNALQAAATALQVFSPASNVNGAIVWSAGRAGNGNGVNPRMDVLLAKTSAPANTADGDCLLATMQSSAGVAEIEVELPRAVRIAAGKGLYWFNDTADTNGPQIRRALYTLL